ncbi:MAG: ExbD/TolR family protein [Deltaproteobacteria bacterium]|nr:ExbD/TolR family protein [Deltaproteobacteria bacterium]
MAAPLPTRGPMAEINVTPFVDVMLVLLVIFMVTAPLLQAGVEIDLPEATAPTLESDDPELDILRIEAFGEVRLNDDVIRFANMEELRLHLLDKLSTRIENPGDGKDIFIQADRAIPYGYVVGIMALLQNMGVDKLGLVTNLPEEGTEPEQPGGVEPRPLEAAPPTTP